MTRTTTAALALLALAGCAPQTDYIPRLDDLSAEGDAAMTLVDRTAVLQGAKDYDKAQQGDAIDLGAVTDGYRMEIASDTIVPESAARAMTHIWAAGGLVLAGDIAAAIAIGPPAIGIGITVDGEITELAPNVWYAENTIPWFGETVTGHLTVAWVGVGWLSEMRLSTSDGALDHDLWFNGFVSEDLAIGWWDFFDDGTLVGVLEWVATPDMAQIGGALTSGDEAGDLLSWTWFSDETANFTLYDASLDETSWVTGYPDGSGEVRMPDYNAGELGCWDPALQDMECPQ